MNEYLLIALIFLVALGVGIYIGKLISGLKSKSETGILEEKNNQLSLHIDELKNQLSSNLEKNKEDIQQLKSEADFSSQLPAGGK